MFFSEEELRELASRPAWWKEYTMSGFRQYRKKQVSYLRPYIQGEDMTGITVNPVDAAAGSPRAGDMIARNQNDYRDMWLISEKFFLDNYEPAPGVVPSGEALS